MTTTIFNQPATATDAPNFRAWGKALSDALAATGLTRTADTGQIDWATVAAPTNGVMVGYEVWQFTDPLQATAPIYFKIEYGIPNTSYARLGIYITVGRATNGAGTLTKTTTRKLGDNSNNGGPPTTGTGYASFAPAQGSLMVAVSAGAGNPFYIGFAIARSIDPATLQPNADGFCLMTVTSSGTSNTPIFEYYNMLNDTIPVVIGSGTSNHLVAFPHQYNASTAAGVDVQTIRAAVFAPKWTYLPWLSYFTGDMSALTPVTIGARTFLPVGKSFGAGSRDAAFNHGMLLPWE